MSRNLLIFLLFISIYDGSSTGSRKTCYLNAGCYKNGAPWNTLLRNVLPPQDPKIAHLFLTFYNRKFRNGIPFDIYPAANMKGIPIDKKKDTYLIIHGYTDTGRLPWILKLKDVLLAKKDVNIFVPDYSKGANGTYFQAAGNIRLFGRLYAETFSKTGISSKKLHVIGHSLGAQLGSYICKDLGAMGQNVSWLTALDPAGPLFEGYDKRVRLDSSDAEFVEVHHTDSGLRGTLLPYGHVDFYYNGGTVQRRCLLHNEYSKISSCDHYMAHQYYISALQYECLIGLPSTLKPKLKLFAADLLRGNLTEIRKHKCYLDSCIPVGLKTKSSPLRGVFTVLTTDWSPYCSKISY